MLIAVKPEILPDEFIDDEIFIGEVRARRRTVVECSKNLGSDPGAYLAHDSLFLKSFLQNFLEFVDGCHFKIR